MAPPSAQSLRLHRAERRLALQHFVKRSSEPLLGRDDSSSSQAVTTRLPHGTSALVGIVVFLSVVVLGFLAWRIYVYRKGKKTAANPRNTMHVGLYDAVDEKDTRSFSSSSGLTPPQTAMTRERSASEFKISLGHDAKVIYIAPQFNEQIEEKPKKASSPKATLQISPPPSYNFPSGNGKVPPSPRTAASIAPRLPQMPSARLPRLVVVETTFQATLHDELEIRVGEILRLLEEYEDEWCLVQRVGPKDSEKGVVPRFCVVDKPSTPPAERRGAHVPRLASTEYKL